MRLLIITQKVDAADANLGFFVRWIEKLSERAEITVIANEVHRDAAVYLPQNVSVHSLGEERGASRFARLIRYQLLLWQNLQEAGGVFFHMCPEYVLGAHLFPRFFHVKTLLWYVHKQVSWRLWLAGKLVDQIFTASKESCRLRSGKVEVVGHGIDTKPQMHADTEAADARRYWQIRRGKETRLHLFTVGRVAPVKDLRTIILGFLELQKKLPAATLSVAGEPVTEGDRRYAEDLRRSFSSRVCFQGGVVHDALPRLYAEATVFVHASRTGSMDKAVLEALAAGLPVFTSSTAFAKTIPGVVKFGEGDPKDVAEKIAQAYENGALGYNAEGVEWVRRNHSLERLVEKIVAYYE